MQELRKHTYALYLCKDTSNPPKQHIFWVDDVWFHGDSKDQKRCHFAGKSSSLDATICDLNGLLFNSIEYTVSTSLTPTWNSLKPHPVVHENNSSTQPNSPNAGEEATPSSEGEFTTASNLGKHTEADEEQLKSKMTLTENELIPEITNFAIDNDYGLVLCSFEFFFLHHKEIAEHCEHAAIFDVRHQAAFGKSELIEAWKTALGNPAVAGDFNSVCGYRLHLELAKCCQSHPNGFNVKDHACFLTSKNGFHDDYLKQLIAMLQANALSKAVHLLRPLVLSKSKTGGVDALRHSLELFNESFRHALKYEYKEDKLSGDFIEQWSNGRLGHEVSRLVNAAGVKNKLYCGSLIELSDSQQLTASEEADIRALFEPLFAAKLRVSTFWSILTHLVGPDGLTNNVPNPTTTTFASAITPHGFLIIGLARFLDKLRASDGHEQRKGVPAVLWVREGKLNFTVTLSDSDTDCATKFLRAISGVSADGNRGRDRSTGARAAWLDLTSGMTSLLGSLEQHSTFLEAWAEKIIQNKKGWPESKLSWKLSADGKSEIEMCIGTTN